VGVEGPATGLAFENCLELREGPLPEPGEGQVRVRNVYLSLEPATGLRMQRETYFDAAVNYKQPDWEARLPVSEPVYALLNKHARVSLCGLISGFRGRQHRQAPGEGVGGAVMDRQRCVISSSAHRQ
jgi:NADPH-dependent curcumin reductase CurA